MRRSWAVVWVGLLAGIVLAGTYLLLIYVKEGIAKDQGYVVHALFRDATGIYDKSRVQTAGIMIGQIDKRTLDPATHLARVDVRIKPGQILYANAAVAKKSASLIGEWFLEVDPGMPVGRDGKPVRQLGDGDRIMTVFEPTDLTTIMDQVGTTVPILKEILIDVQKLTSGPITQIAGNVNELIERNSKTLESLLQRVDNIAANVEGITDSEKDDIHQIVSNVKDITASVQSLVGKTEGEVTQTGQATRETIDKLKTTVGSLEKSIHNIEKVTGKVAAGEGTLGQLLTDDTIANNVESITADAGTFLSGITTLQTIVGIRTEYNVLAGTVKSYLAVQLQPRPDKFYLVEIVDDPRGFRQEKTTLTESSDQGTVREKQVTISERLRFSFMLGKRMGPLTMRIGLKESTGGAGMDVHIFNDRLALSADVFDTRANVYPRAQARAALALWDRYVWAIVGVDDFLNRFRARAGGGGGLDAFGGLSLTFNDQDLKTMLLFGGSAIGAASSK